MSHENNIFYRNLDHYYYLSANKALSYVVQQLQFEMDKELGLFDLRKNANVALNIWGLHA
jgi:hypothetical protein